MSAAYDAKAIRARLAFDIERLRSSARRIEIVDAALVGLKMRLESRALTISEAAHNPVVADRVVPRVRYAQAHAVAQLARRAALAEILQSSSALPLVASMAVARWVMALATLAPAPRGEGAVKLHVEAGRVACRVFKTLRRGRGLRSGVGRLTSAVVVAEFLHPDDVPWAEIEIDHGLHSARFSRSIHSSEEALAAASAFLREAASILERVAERAEPAVDALLARAEVIEDEVAAGLVRG